MNDESGRPSRRLGKRELGRHAFEQRMPDRIATLVAHEDDQNALSGVISSLAQLLRRDPDVEVAYLCTKHAVQVHKLPGEGAHFCSYRNMQMLCLALGLSERQRTGEIDLRRKLSIAQLQDLIQSAWDRGMNAHGRQQTGGIKGTRKHVGTSEAEALFLSLDIPCAGTVFEGKDASAKLLDFVEMYFSASAPGSCSERSIYLTSLPPVFLQRPHHSVTVAGIIRMRSGKRRILVFDPAWRPPTTIQEATKETGTLTWRDLLALRRYSKSERYLKRFKAFEILTIAESKG